MTRHKFLTKILLPAFLFFAFFIIYLATSKGNTPYDYFTRLGTAFLQGKYYLTENPPWLNELIPAGNNRFFTVYPPMPAILSIPFIFLFGSVFKQQWLAHLLGAGIVLFSYKLAYRQTGKVKTAVWTGVFAGAGTIIWYLSATGSVWYTGQVCACFFLLAALNEALFKKRPVITGIILGSAYLSRLQSILALPLLLFLVGETKENRYSNWFKLALGFAPFALFNFYFNYIRFGTIFDRGYFLIPGLMLEPWYAQGLFHISYIPKHLKIIFTALPIFQNQAPYIKPSWAGLAIWITSPAFIYALFAPFKKYSGLIWLSIFLISAVIFSHGSTGFTQFGYRFAVDFYPFLILLTILSISKTGLKWHHWILLFVSVLINFWGVVWINFFGWVGY